MKLTKILGILLAVLLVTAGFAGAASANEISDSVSTGMTVAKAISIIESVIVTGGATIISVIESVTAGSALATILANTATGLVVGAAMSAAAAAMVVAAVAFIAAIYGSAKYIINHWDNIKSGVSSTASSVADAISDAGGIDPAYL